ncbi:MAG: helix-turn-helix domain-containing protein, partial [Pseudonocardiaceae bacterium]
MSAMTAARDRFWCSGGKGRRIGDSTADEADGPLELQTVAVPGAWGARWGVPFARPGSGFTRDFEQLVAWLATKSDKTTICKFARVVWRTVWAICERVSADVLNPERLSGLVDIGVDEISWKKHHHYLTLVSDHATGKIVWG